MWDSKTLRKDLEEREREAKTAAAAVQEAKRELRAATEAKDGEEAKDGPA